MRATIDFGDPRDTRRDPHRLPTPLSAPRARPVVRPGRPARDRAPRHGAPGCARVDDVAGHDPRGPAADPRAAQRLDGWARFPSRVLAGARGPGRTRLDTATRRRSSAGSTPRAPRPRPRSTAARSTRCTASRRPRRRSWRSCSRTSSAAVNIALVNELAQLCDRMGLDLWEVDRRRGDEAVRLHAASSRARARAATASRSTRSTSRGGRGRSTAHASSSSSPDVNANMPYYAVSPVARALNQRGEVAARGAGPPARRRLQGRRRRHAREPARAADGAARAGGADVDYHDPHVPALPGRLAVGAARRGRAWLVDCVVIATAHTNIDY